MTNHERRDEFVRAVGEYVEAMLAEYEVSPLQRAKDVAAAKYAANAVELRTIHVWWNGKRKTIVGTTETAEWLFEQLKHFHRCNINEMLAFAADTAAEMWQEDDTGGWEDAFRIATMSETALP
jgi:hypothetical protein